MSNAMYDLMFVIEFLVNVCFKIVVAIMICVYVKCMK